VWAVHGVDEVRKRVIQTYTQTIQANYESEADNKDYNKK